MPIEEETMDRNTSPDNNVSSIREMLSTSGYGEKAIEYYLTKPNQGPMRYADQITELTGPCGDTMKTYLKVIQGKIHEVKFDVLGCPGAVSAAMALADLVRGKDLNSALQIQDGEVFKALGEIPDQKQHCIRLAVKTLAKAIKEYQDTAET